MVAFYGLLFYFAHPFRYLWILETFRRYERMMTKIREKTHILLYILVLCFVGLIVIEWGANYSDIARTKRGVIGKVGGEDVRYADFQTAYFNQVQQMQQQRDGESLSETELEMVSDQIWNQITEELLLRKFIHKNNITVGDSEIVYHLRSNPPDFLRQSPTFQTDGNFDYNKYLQALNNPAYARTWAEIENILRSQLPYTKLQRLITQAARVTEAELRNEYARRNLKLSGQLIYFSPSDFADQTFEISDAELQTYYDDHTDDFKQPAKAVLGYVTFPVIATPEDSADVMDRLDDIKKQLNEGKDFTDLAKTYSQEPGASSSGGDLGWFTRGRMVAAFEEACFNAKAGEIVGPIFTQFGYHLINVEETRFKTKRQKDAGELDSVKARHILLKMEASPTTVENIRENANVFHETAKEQGFAAAMEKYKDRFNLTVQTTADMVENDFGMIAGFPDRSKQIVRFAFNDDIGSVSRAFRTNSGFSIFTVTKSEKAGIRSFEDVKDDIRNTLLEEKRKAMAFDRAKEVRSKINSLSEAKAVDSSLVIRDLNGFTINNSVAGVGRDGKLAGFLFQVPTSTISDAFMGTRGAYIVQVFTRDEFNEAKYTGSREELRKSLLSAKQQRMYREWLEQYKKANTIEDFRADFNL